MGLRDQGKQYEPAVSAACCAGSNCLHLAGLAVSSLTKFMEVWLADLMAACCLGTASLDLEALDHKKGP